MLKTSFSSPVSGVLFHLLFLLSITLLVTALLSTGRHDAMGFMGAFLLVPSFYGMLDREEFELDVVRQRYRRFVSIFGLKLGSWQPLPPVQAVIIRHYSEFQAATTGKYSWGIWQNEQAIRSIIILLSVPGQRQGIIITKLPAHREDEAYTFAQLLASRLQVDLQEFD